MSNWVLDEDGLGADFAEITNSSAELIALVRFRPDQEANARLIAAAPALLDLAKQYASECAECLGKGVSDDTDQDCQQCRDIRQVIAVSVEHR